MKNNQALTMYPLFFDPIYKKAEMKKIDGKDCICYQEDFWGTKVEEDGSVTFTMEAPKAETVEVRFWRNAWNGENCTGEAGKRTVF